MVGNPRHLPIPLYTLVAERSTQSSAKVSRVSTADTGKHKMKKKAKLRNKELSGSPPTTYVNNSVWD